MESGLLPTHILSFLPHGIQITFITPPEAGRKKGASRLAQKSLEEKEIMFSAAQQVTVAPMGAQLT